MRWIICAWIPAHDQKIVSYYLVVKIPNSVRFTRAESGKIAYVLDTACNDPALFSAILSYMTNAIIDENCLGMTI
jgi:hypothetical protein